MQNPEDRPRPTGPPAIPSLYLRDLLIVIAAPVAVGILVYLVARLGVGA